MNISNLLSFAKQEETKDIFNLKIDTETSSQESGPREPPVQSPHQFECEKRPAAKSVERKKSKVNSKFSFCLKLILL